MTDARKPDGGTEDPAERGRGAGGERPDLSARDLQTNASQDELETEPGSDADQANEVAHVG